MIIMNKKSKKYYFQLLNIFCGYKYILNNTEINFYRAKTCDIIKKFSIFIIKIEKRKKKILQLLKMLELLLNLYIHEKVVSSKIIWEIKTWKIFYVYFRTLCFFHNSEIKSAKNSIFQIPNSIFWLFTRHCIDTFKTNQPNFMFIDRIEYFIPNSFYIYKTEYEKNFSRTSDVFNCTKVSLLKMTYCSNVYIYSFILRFCEFSYFKTIDMNIHQNRISNSLQFILKNSLQIKKLIYLVSK
nr:hypothetical protein 1634Bnrm1_p039 [Cryptomonas sp.]